jgi:hypothetical protein
MNQDGESVPKNTESPIHEPGPRRIDRGLGFQHYQPGYLLALI